MNGKTTTTVQTAPPSPEENAYLQSQQALAAKQLEILGSQQDFNQSYMDQIKPILDQQNELLSKSLAAANDPIQAELQQKTTQAQLQALQDNADLAPLQKQVLQAQLQATLKGPGATPEQSAQIDAASKAALDSGTSDINDFQTTALQSLRNNLAPGLGLRPSDTPIVDRGQLVAKEAVRQQGQLATSLAGANAQAKLNYPLAASGVQQAGADFSANLGNAASAFQASLADAAATNRLRLLSSGSDAIGTGINQGIGLVTGSRGNPLSFSRGQTTTQSSSPGLSSILGGIGGLASGIGALGGSAGLAGVLALSDERMKTDIQTVGNDRAGRRWVNFEYKGDPSHVRHVGVIAQEVEKSDPEAVLTNGIGLKFVDYSKLRAA